MQIISTTITLPVAGTAYSVATRLAAKGVQIPLTGRVAGIKLQASNKDVYFVDHEGPVTMQANVPVDFGYKLKSNHGETFEESQHPANQISLGDIILVAGENDGFVHVWAYTV